MKKIIYLAIAILVFTAIPAAFAADKEDGNVLAYWKDTNKNVQPIDREEQRRQEEINKSIEAEKKFLEVAVSEILEHREDYKEFWSMVENSESKDSVICIEALHAMRDLAAGIQSNIEKSDYVNASSKIVLQYFIFMYPNKLCTKFEKAK